MTNSYVCFEKNKQIETPRIHTFISSINLNIYYITNLHIQLKITTIMKNIDSYFVNSINYVPLLCLQ